MAVRLCNRVVQALKPNLVISYINLLNFMFTVVDLSFCSLEFNEFLVVVVSSLLSVCKSFEQ